MKKSLIALAVMAASSFVMAHGSSGSVTGSNEVTSGSSAFASSAGTGLSISKATNTQFATNAVYSSGSGTAFGPLKSGHLSQGGAVTTGGASTAFNASVGNATGAAEGVGYSFSTNEGKGEFHTSGNGPKGNTSGFSTAETGTKAVANKNGMAVSTGAAAAEWSAAASANRFQATFLDKKDASTSAGATAGSANTGFSVGNASNSQLTNAESGARANSWVAGVVSSTH